MVEFNQWTQAIIFNVIFASIIILPCIFATIIGRNLIDQLGAYPTQTALIQMSIFWKFVVLEIITFIVFILFFNYFSSVK